MLYLLCSFNCQRGRSESLTNISISWKKINLYISFAYGYHRVPFPNVCALAYGFVSFHWWATASVPPFSLSVLECLPLPGPALHTERHLENHPLQGERSWLNKTRHAS